MTPLRLTALLWAIVATLGWAVLSLPAMLLGMFSPMMFDAPTSVENPRIWTAVIAVWTYIPVAAVAIAASWILFALRRFALSLVVTLLPLVNVVALAQIAWM